MTSPVPLPPAAAVLATPRRNALDAFLGAGWRPYVRPIALDAERARLLNIDLSEPDVGFERDGALVAVAHVETDREGLVTHLELVGADAADPVATALALLGEIGPPKIGAGAGAREWIWGPESGAQATAGGEPVRLWICAERAYGDRLWAVASLVRRD